MAEVDEEPKTLLEQHLEKRKKSGKRKEDKDDPDKIDKEKLKKALEKEEAHTKLVEKQMELDERKRSYNSKYDDKTLSPEEIEAYHIKR